MPINKSVFKFVNESNFLTEEEKHNNPEINISRFIRFQQI